MNNQIVKLLTIVTILINRAEETEIKTNPDTEHERIKGEFDSIRSLAEEIANDVEEIAQMVNKIF